jgi:hypothetical protein
VRVALAAGVLMTSYEEPQNKRLKDFFKVLSLSLARDGLPYISTMEARKVRMYMTWYTCDRPLVQ